MSITINITQGDVDNIAKKLDEFAEVLTEKERTIFLAVLNLAGKELKDKLQSLKPGGEKPTSTSGLPSLSAGFKTAFEPSVGAKLTYDETGESELKVTIIIEK